MRVMQPENQVPPCCFSGGGLRLNGVWGAEWAPASGLIPVHVSAQPVLPHPADGPDSSLLQEDHMQKPHCHKWSAALLFAQALVIAAAPMT